MNGYDFSNPQYSLDYTQKGGNQAGGTERAQRFDNSRAESDKAPGLSFYRNRYYDQATGRWLQEDPIGISGGVNLYTYGGNNPAAYTDPFGLRLCFPGGDQSEEKKTLEQATGTIIHLDGQGCATGFDVVDHSRKYRFAQWMLDTIIRSGPTVYVRGGPPNFDHIDGLLYLDPKSAGTYVGHEHCGGGIGSFLSKIFGKSRSVPVDVQAQTNHELTHAYDYAVGLITSETPATPKSPERQRFEARALVMEDLFNSTAGNKLRCSYENFQRR